MTMFVQLKWVKLLVNVVEKHLLKETKSVTMNIFRNFLFSF